MYMRSLFLPLQVAAPHRAYDGVVLFLRTGSIVIGDPNRSIRGMRG